MKVVIRVFERKS